MKKLRRVRRIREVEKKERQRGKIFHAAIPIREKLKTQFRTSDAYLISTFLRKRNLRERERERVGRGSHGQSSPPQCRSEKNSQQRP